MPRKADLPEGQFVRILVGMRNIPDRNSDGSVIFRGALIARMATPAEQRYLGHRMQLRDCEA